MDIETLKRAAALLPGYTMAGEMAAAVSAEVPFQGVPMTTETRDKIVELLLDGVTGQLRALGVTFDDDGWIENTSGVCPGPVSHVRFRNGAEYALVPGHETVRWTLEGSDADITHFKPQAPGISGHPHDRDAQAQPDHLTITLTGPQASGKTRVGEYIKAILGSYGARVTDDDGPFCYHTPPLDVIRGCQITVTSS